METKYESRTPYVVKEVVPITEDYARRPIDEGFDWTDILENFAGGYSPELDDSLYLVVFRSQRAPNADEQIMMEHDRRAHEAAKRSPALLYYFGGDADEEGYCLSFCLWDDRQAAGMVVSDPDHRAAAALTAKMYSSFSLERYDIYPYDDYKPVFLPT